VLIDATPWARFQITPVRQSDGAAPSEGVTPMMVELPLGEYTVQFSNPMASSRVTKAEMPGLDVDRIVGEILPQ
jgi:hypothetical protein